MTKKHKEISKSFPVIKDEDIQIHINSLGHNGEGVGSYQQLAVFVDQALPGENVKVKVTSCHKRYAKAQLLSIITPSPERVSPPCPLFGKCGGCQLMHLSYHKQLKIKRQRIVDAFERIGLLKEVSVLPCIASPLPLGYRNKIQLPMKPSLNGEVLFGLYEKGSHQLVEVDHCYIHCPLGEKIFQSTSTIVKKSSLKAYDVKKQTGTLRHLLIKSSLYSQQGLVVFVTRGPKTDELVAVAEELLKSCPEVVGVIHNRNDRNDNIILGQEYTLLAGSSCVEEKLCGLTFKISPASFFQVNPQQAEKMYEQALSFANLTGVENVLDAYCGVGTLSLIFAKKAREVIGIENVEEACSDAKENASLNGIENVKFICNDVKMGIKRLEKIDVLLLNPPRQGCEVDVLHHVQQLNPKVVIYISCDPATLARDLAVLADLGYIVDGVQPFDMFPQTAHVETIVKMIKPKVI